MAGFQLITFDLDDTLWAVEPVIERANRVLCAWLEENVPELATGVPSGALVQYGDQVLAEQPELAAFVTRLRLQMLRRMLTAAGVDARDIEPLAQAAFEAFLHARHAVEYHPRALELLQELAADYALAALSNGNADVQRLEIGAYFDFAISAECVGAGKPDPAMFHQACRRAGCKPQQVLHIGDHPEHDVLGARRAGMHAIWVREPGQQWDADQSLQPSASVHCLSEIPALIRTLEQGLER